MIGSAPAADGWIRRAASQSAQLDAGKNSRRIAARGCSSCVHAEIFCTSNGHSDLAEFLAALVVAAAVVVGALRGFQSSPANRPWPPGVQKMPPESPPFSPEEALKTFYMPPGYRVELVASEPLIQEPVAIDWDIEGPAVGGRDARIHGRHHAARTSTIRSAASWCSRTRTPTAGWTSARCSPIGLVLARSLKVLDRGVLVAEPPNVWLMRDTNGDLRMDTKELVTDSTAGSTAIRRTTPTASTGRSTTGCTPPGRPTSSFG